MRRVARRSRLLAALAVVLLAPRAPAQDADLFETRVRPVLAAHCLECHGPEKAKSGLRLDSLDGMLAGGSRGPAIVPGSPEESRLVQAVRWTDPELSMPPRDRLDADTVAGLVAWIAAGATVPEDFRRAPDGGAAGPRRFDLAERLGNWSLQPLRDPELPAVRHPERVADPVDAFLEARLEEAGVEPSPRADRATLLRRLYLDLVGIPPTVEERARFLADTRPDAWEREVDRLLASPGFGERWARHWLDLVRYAESKGHEFDFRIPNAWQYRDWVVRALQDDVPYDRFVMEQVAGDLLATPRPSRDGGWDESPLGTGFWYLGEEVHSPVDVRADQVTRLANQVDVLSKAVLGLTVGCARCHDHKFDAVPTEDYYALCGFLVSSRYHQVRFESREANARVEQELEALEREHAPAVARAYGGAWLDAADALPALLRAGREVATTPREALPGLAAGEAPPGTDRLLADFEGDGWDGWTATGTAFGARPVRADEVPDYQGDLGGRGRGVANSHAATRSDAAVGTLTSPPFVVDRRWLHLLLGGGAHPGETGVELLVGDTLADATVVAALTGRNANRMEPRRIDLARWRGRTAWLRAVDRATGGWGNVGLDQVVLSDRGDPDVLAGDPRLRAARALLAERVAARDGLAPARVRAAAAACTRAREDPGDALHALLAAPPQGDAAPSPSPATGLPDAGAATASADGEWAATSAVGPAVLVDWGTFADRAPQWIVDGPTFGTGPRAVGEVRLGDDPARPLAGVTVLAGAYADPVWDGLALAPGVEREDSAVDWVQCGRTYQTPTFRVPAVPLWYLVTGPGEAFAPVDGHRLINGPLHGRTIVRWQGAGLRWVEHDLTEYAGQRAHVELSPAASRAPGEEPLAVHAIVASATEPPLPDVRSATTPEAAASAAGTSGAASLDAGADRLVDAVRQAARALADGTLDRGTAPLADWLARHPELLPRSALEGPVRAAFAPWREARAAVLARRVLESHTAPAILDGNGVDEVVLVRGDPRAPADPAPRRAPVCVAGLDQPPVGPGSGRLALAERLVSPDDPLFARVFVNRVWHHLFGRGLVATVDNLGALGAEPTNPDLLDWLATWTRADGFSLKRLVRLLVTSEAYRRSSDPRPDLAAVDPDDRLWERALVRRLEGEALRDTILSISGGLDPTPFGPPVPVHLTDFLDGRGRPSVSGPVDGAGRRSIWQAVRRNFPQPFFSVFDTPVPTTTVGRRTVTNVPAQALALLDDPFVLGEAERWARNLAKTVPDPDARLERMFLAAYGRPITAHERALCRAFLASAAQSEAPPEPLRSWTDLAHVLLNEKELAFVR